MILSRIRTQWTPRRLSLCVAALTLGLLPLGVAHAQDFEAVERRLGEAVAAGEITLDQAQAMMQALRRTATPRERRGISRREQAQPRERKAADNRQRRLAAALYEAGVPRDKIREVLGAMERITWELHTEGEHFELDPRLARYLTEELGLTEEQVEKVVGLSKTLVAEERRLSREDYDRVEAELKQLVEAGELSREDASARLKGMRRELAARRRPGAAESAGDATLLRLSGALVEAGVSRESLRDVLGAMERIAFELRAEGERFELDPGMARYLVGELGLTKEQVAQVVALSKKLPAEVGLADALSRAGVPHDKIRGVLGAVGRTVIEVHEEGSAFALDPRLHEHLRAEGLSYEQVELVVSLAKQEWTRRVDAIGGMSRAEYDGVVAGIDRETIDPESLARLMAALNTAMETGDRAIYGEKKPAREEASDWDAIIQRIEDAVESGEMTREEAEAAYLELRGRRAEDR